MMRLTRACGYLAGITSVTRDRRWRCISRLSTRSFQGWKGSISLCKRAVQIAGKLARLPHRARCDRLSRVQGGRKRSWPRIITRPFVPHAVRASLYITLRLRVCNCEHRSPRKPLIYVFIQERCSRARGQRRRRPSRPSLSLSLSRSFEFLFCRTREYP